MKSFLRILTPADGIVIGGLAIASFLLIVLSLARTAGGIAEVYIDNVPAGEIDLSVDSMYTFEGDISPISVEVKDNKTHIHNSGCPLKLCMKQGYIGKVGESIICLPNKFLIVVTGGENSSLHGVTG